MTVSPSVTWPSAAITTLPSRRTQRTVVERIRMKLDYRCNAHPHWARVSSAHKSFLRTRLAIATAASQQIILTPRHTIHRLSPCSEGFVVRNLIGRPFLLRRPVEKVPALIFCRCLLCGQFIGASSSLDVLDAV